MKSLAFEPDGSRLDVALYRNVRNGAALVKLLTSGKSGVEAALVNARLVPSLLVVQAAAWKALCDSRTATMTTKNVHSELVFCLSPDNAISRSLKTFGVSETSDCVLVCLVNATEEQRHAALRLVEGELAKDVDAGLREVCDVAAVREAYQVTAVESAVTPLQDAVINRISAKVSKKSELTRDAPLQ